MKTTGFRAGVLYLLLILFVSGIAYLIYSVVVNGGDFISQSYNGHIYATNGTASLGNIYDSDGEILAETIDGIRVYNDDESVRISLLHTVGDSSGYIGTSIQSTFLSELLGYNIFTGLNTIKGSDYVFSNDITLTIDSDLNAAAYEALDGKNGAVLIYNYLTGEVLCKVSTPAYDPMNIPDDLTTDEFYEGVFVDNTLSSTYTPGSIFKIIVTACAIENGIDIENTEYCCEGVLYFDDSTLTCLESHGYQDIYEAMGNSCNVYFANLAIELGAEKLQETAEQLGFNINFDFEESLTTSSKINLDDVNSLELAWASVGQYTITVNPMHMLILMGAIGNDGVAIMPYVVDDGFFSTSTDEITLMSSETATLLEDILRTVVTDYYGDAKFGNIDFCAKTGTAEVDGQDPNSWFVGYSANDDTPYAVVVVVEDSGSGMYYAGNIASDLINLII